MSRIDDCLQELAANGRKALIPFVTAGDPELTLTVPLMHAMVKSGADIIELGVAFSDPMADGPVIQAACERALAAGVSLKHVLAMVSEFRQDDDSTPVVLMGYLNPIESMGYEAFAAAASAAGVDGVLIVDLSAEEAAFPVSVLRSHHLDSIFLAAPTTTSARLGAISRLASGYLYYVSLKGVTGSAALDTEAVDAKVKVLRSHIDVPIAVGFGIRDAQSAAAVAAVSDAVVVGSALVGQIAKLAPDHAAIIESVSAILGGMREAMDELS